MNKKILFITIIASFFFISNNVKASTNLGKVFIDENILNNSIEQINNYNGSNENMIIYKNQLLEYMNIQEDEDYFIYINYSYRTIEGYKWKKTTEWEKEPGLYLGTINTSKDYIYGNFQINFNAYVKNENKLINSYKIYYENTSSYDIGTKMKNSDTYYIQKYDPFLKGNFQSDEESGTDNYIVDEEYKFVNEFLNHYYESSIDIKLTYNNDKIARGKLDYYFDELGITNEEEKIDITSYKLGDILFDSSGSNTWGEPPKITFNVDIPDYCKQGTQEEPIYNCKLVTAKITNLDTNKHYFKIKVDNTFKSTTDVTDTYNYLFSNNGIMNVSIYNKNNDTFITDNELHVVGIDNKYDTITTPYVILNGEYKKDSGWYEVNAYVFHYDKNYNYYYSFDGGNTFKVAELAYFRDLVSDMRVFTDEYQEDGLFIFKIEDKNGNIIDEQNLYVNFALEKAKDNYFYPYYKNLLDKFPIIQQTIDIYTVFSVTKISEKPPKITVDLSFLGIKVEKSVIDFTFYDKYRDYVFVFLEFGLAIVTFYKIIMIVKSSIE